MKCGKIKQYLKETPKKGFQFFENKDYLFVGLWILIVLAVIIVLIKAMAKRRKSKNITRLKKIPLEKRLKSLEETEIKKKGIFKN